MLAGIAHPFESALDGTIPTAPKALSGARANNMSRLSLFGSSLPLCVEICRKQIAPTLGTPHSKPPTRASTGAKDCGGVT